MRTLFAAILLVCALAAGATRAQERDNCEVPSFLLFGESDLTRVAAAVKDRHQIDIAVVGTASSILPGQNGAAGAYPSRLEAALRRRLPGVTVNGVSEAKPRQTATEMAQAMKKLLNDRKPVLVIWQSGTVDAMRGIDPERYRAALDGGVETLQAGGADVILMNMQYSPRTESMIALGAYADSMRAVAREREVPLFDRLAIMRQWSDNGAFDLHTATNTLVMAQQVHDCLGRALASVIIDAAHLGVIEHKAAQ